MKKILFIHHATGWGGAPKSMIELIKSLDKEKFNPTVLLIKDSIVSEKLQEFGINYIIAKSPFYKKYYTYIVHSEAGYTKWYNIFKLIKSSLLWILSKYYFAPKELKSINTDIIHLNSSVLTDWLKPSNKVAKVIIHIREPFRNGGKLDLLHMFFRRQMKKYADRIIAISNDNANRVNLPTITEVVYNYADVPSIKATEESYFSKKFLYLGGASSIKGFKTMVEALDLLEDDITILFGGSYFHSSDLKMNKVKFLLRDILGVNSKHDKLINLVRTHPRAKEVGMINDVNGYIQKVSCLISPFSVTHFSRPIIEANLMAKPVICSDIEGIDEIVSDKVNGLIFEKNNAKQLAKTINFAAKKNIEMKKMGEQGFIIASDKFTPRNISKIINVYDDILNN